ncbi:multisubunit sodium/proton antiporter MrpD subunit [Luteococcus japonicus]|uniref:Na(+) H(+) antiporter subunit D n=2 Tax=Luteococcus japonicus TaxID=33984 RepID=A0A1R4J0U1_9ACTN|nr:Na+/H+ antiporter subunit D [Luteococcus japonicus]ROR54066.1 multisubunit sodium/proton antiporter MrpD subunit [Luteococcus japonicus]SJN25667.1 Na(+) H(+) antiporter subunit D [Luteococcus japonicus LSP_Lj1]
MSFTSADLVPLPVVLPLIGAGLTVVAGRRTVLQRIVTALVLGSVVVVAALLLGIASGGERLVIGVGGWAPVDGIVLVVDRLSALMLLVSSVVTFAVMLYAIGEGHASEDLEDGGAPLPIFHPSLLVLSAGVSTTFLSGDLFHVYVGFEMLLFASFVLLTLGGTESRVRAGANYVVVNLLSSLVFLLAIGLIYAATGTVDMAQLAGRLDDLAPATAQLLQGMLLVGFCIKAAVFPMSGWLPDSYPTAPAPVTAVFAGLLTKVGVYAMIRTQTLLFPDDGYDQLLLVAALLTMVVGILGALAQDDIKRLLSFTLVSHIGYLVFGISIGNELGLSSAIFYAAHHITIQTCLFLVTGLIEHRGGSTSLSHLGGFLRMAPGLALLFFLPALNLAGIPPLSGFLGKVGLLRAGTQSGTSLAYLLVGGSLVTSLLTLYAISRVWGRAFWRGPRAAMEDDDGALVDLIGDEAEELVASRPLPRGIVWPTAALVTVSCVFTVVAGPLFAYTDAAATQLGDRAGYVADVLGVAGR